MQRLRTQALPGATDADDDSLRTTRLERITDLARKASSEGVALVADSTPEPVRHLPPPLAVGAHRAEGLPMPSEANLELHELPTGGRRHRAQAAAKRHAMTI